MDVERRLKAYAEPVDARLRELLPPSDRRPFELHAAMRYSCLAPGKRLRPALCLATAEALGGSEAAMDAACAVEMVHCFSLIHDDLPALDNDDLRRGMPTCHVQFGEAIAILAGDALFSLALETVARLAARPDRVVRCMQILTQATGPDGLVGGETVDILSEGQAIDAETLEYIHTRKTGALIAASVEIGAELAGGPFAEPLRQYGEAIGLAFQIADDVLNETSSAEQLGKAAGSDRERKKATYPALYGLEKSREAARAWVNRGLTALSEVSADTSFLAELAEYSIERMR